jgi:hypothetical protein
MSTYDDTNRGSLFSNKKKTKDNQPDFTGSLNVNGAKFRLSVWKKTSKAGEAYMSVSVQPDTGWSNGGGDLPRLPERTVSNDDMPF